MAEKRLPTLDDDDKLPQAFLPDLGADDVGADPEGTAAAAVVAHTSATDPHGDRAFATSAVTAEASARAGADSSIDAGAVHKAGAETIAGVKTFSASPIVPTPTTSGQTANKGYVDSTMSAHEADTTNVHGIPDSSRIVMYGPPPSGGDDTAALQAVLSAVPAAGGRVLLQAGNYSVPNGGLTCDKPVTIEGAGAGTYESGGTRILCSSATATVLTLSSPGSAVIGVAFVNTAVTTPTAGGALLCTDFDFGRVERCLFRGFWNAMQVDVGFFYSIRDTAFLGPINYGCYMRNNASGQFDHGDQVLEGVTFSKMGNTADGGTAVRWESGGGLKLIGCKANGATMPGYPDTGLWSRIVDVFIVDGTATSVLVVSGCSLEGFKGSGIRVEGAAGAGDATAGFGKVVITGNEFFQFGPQIEGGYSVNLDFSNAEAALKYVSIVGNVFTGYGCRMARVEAVTFVGNEMGYINDAALDMIGVKNMVQGDNFFDTYVIDYDATETYQLLTDAGYARGRPWTYKKDTKTLTTNAFFGKVKPGDWSAGVMTVRVSANVASAGGAQLVQKRAITRGGAGSAAVVAATVGTDLAFGDGAAQLSITFDVSTETGFVKPKVTSLNGNTVRACVEVEFDGPAHIVSYAN